MPIKVIGSKKKGDYWDVIIEHIDSGEATVIAKGVCYKDAYQAKLAAEKRQASGQLIIPRRPVVTI